MTPIDPDAAVARLMRFLAVEGVTGQRAQTSPTPSGPP